MARSTPWSEVLALTQKLAHERGFDTEQYHHTLITENAVRDHAFHSLSEAVAFLKRLSEFESFQSQTDFYSKNGEDRLDIGLVVGNVVKVQVTASHPDMIEGIQHRLEQEYQFRNPVIPKAESPLNLQPTIFVGRHFDSNANEAFGSLSTFLSLLGFDVSQGLEYSSRDIPEKVKERIDRQDVFVALVTGDRDHAWLHSEPAYAMAKRKHIILMVEEGANYDPTLIGKDLEQIRFPPSMIEKAFISLLRELRNIRVRGL